MNFQFIKPTGILARYIRHYWVMESGPNPAITCERVIPTGNLQLMFHYKNPFVVHYPDETKKPQGQSFISGISSSYCDVSTTGESGVIAVEFYPSGAGYFFKFPLSEVENRNVSLVEIYGKEVREMEERIQQVMELDKKISIIENFMLKKYSPLPAHDENYINAGVNYVRKARGQLSGSALAGYLSLTTKSLERKFSMYLGKTPKQYIKLVRFHETLKDIERNPVTDLTSIAYGNGYFDQSHFIREFKTYSGFTPREYILALPCENVNTDFGS